MGVIDFMHKKYAYVGFVFLLPLSQAQKPR